MILGMKVFVFGNRDQEKDDRAVLTAERLGGSIKNVEFVEVGANEDLPFVGQKAVLMDTVAGIEQETVLGEGQLSGLVLGPRGSVHDFDLGFQIKYLKKLGRLGEVKIIGLPMGRKPDYSRIKSILRKLVAQDMQGS